MIIPNPRIEPIRTKSIWDTPRYRIVEDYTITIDDGLPIIFPSGFETDLASIPRFMWSIPGFSHDGPLLYGSIPHDFGYQHGYLLTPYLSTRQYPAESLQLAKKFSRLFNGNIPIFMGRNQHFFDSLLEGITIEATGSTFVSKSARSALRIFGKSVWNNYRTKGPSAYNYNSLGLPGLTDKGPKL